MAVAYVSRAYCVADHTETSWFLIGQEGDDGTRVLYWRCRSCDRTRMQLADLTDALQLCETARGEWERAHGRHEGYDRDDFLDQLRLELWHAYLVWDGRCSFLAFGTFRLRARAVSYFRKRNGADDRHRKADAGADSLDALDLDGDRLDVALGRGAVDGGEDRASPLARELTRRGRVLADLDARQARHPGVGREEDARAAC
jgi:hypothetical protein